MNAELKENVFHSSFIVHCSSFPLCSLCPLWLMSGRASLTFTIEVKAETRYLGGVRKEPRRHSLSEFFVPVVSLEIDFRERCYSHFPDQPAKRGSLQRRPDFPDGRTEIGRAS